MFYFLMGSVECYDTCTKQWKFVASMNHARRYVATAALGGLLYAVGGYDGMSVLDSVEVYDPKVDQWKGVASMINRRRHVAVGVLITKVLNKCTEQGEKSSYQVIMIIIQELAGSLLPYSPLGVCGVGGGGSVMG